ncbi:hypothetical protein ACFV5N_00965 [Streptomyces sp. NPDC059853]|uniref:hypothetical protein n=1 Tax=Streptomyces sp. NPDC059853 TaxID=3346973 RepID=UPI00365D7DC1
MSPPDDGQEPGSVYISAAQIYGEVRRQSDLLLRLSVQLEEGRYEQRIRALERRVCRTGGRSRAGGFTGASTVRHMASLR